MLLSAFMLSQRWCTSHRTHDNVRDNCLLGCAGSPDSLSGIMSAAFRSGWLWAPSMTPIPVPMSHVHGLGDASAVVCHTASDRKLILATMSYHAVRATHRQQGPLAYGRATTPSKFEHLRALISKGLLEEYHKLLFDPGIRVWQPAVQKAFQGDTSTTTCCNATSMPN